MTKSLKARLRARHTSDQLAVRVELADDSDWVGVQAWTHTVDANLAGLARRRRLIDGARDHGWLLPLGKWPGWNAAGELELAPLQVDSWDRVLRGVTLSRSEAVDRFVSIDGAWRDLVAEATAGWLRTEEIAAAANVTRWRIYQIVKEHDKVRQNNRVATATATQARTKRRA